MDKEFKTVAEVAQELRENLQDKELTESRVRNDADFFLDVEKNPDNQYRMFTEKDIKTLKGCIVFCKLGISRQDVKDFFEKTVTAPVLIAMTQKIHNSKSTLIPEAEKILAKFTFESQPIVTEGKE